MAVWQWSKPGSRWERYPTAIRPYRHTGLHFPAPFQGLDQGGLIRVVQVAADGKAEGYLGHADAERLDEARQVHGRGVAFHRRIRGENDLLHPAVLNPLHQLADAEHLRA